MQRNGKTFVIYAANESWTDNECLGMLVNTDGNYLNPASWTKMSQPILKTYTGPNGSVYGPGHCGLTQSLDGTQDWIVYHAAQYSGAGWTRNIRMQQFTWGANGYPTFGQPIPAGVVLADPSGDDYTPASLTAISMQAGGHAQVTARAPLPLLTNTWSVQASSDLKSWSGLTNLSGTILLSRRSSTGRECGAAVTYRVKSAR